MGEPDLDEAVADLLRTMNTGQFILLLEAIRQLGGELRIERKAFANPVRAWTSSMQVDASDGPVVLRIADPE